jgi:Ca2+-binding RTX toxin-like protein
VIGPNATNAWSITGINQEVLGSITFSSFENLTGGTGADTFTVKATIGSVGGLIDGGDGNDTLVGFGLANTWNLTGVRAGNLNGSSFQAIENLTGGASTDLFKFTNAAGGFSTIAGGAGANTLDYSLTTSPITVNFQTNSAPKVASFSGIQALVGGSGQDTLIGPNTATAWAITGVNRGMMGLISFSSFENLTGGTAADTVKIIASGSLSGWLNGGGGGDILNYSLYIGSGVTVNLAAGTATHIGGTVSNFHIVIGTAAADSITGDGTGNILIGGAGADVLQGGAGRDLLIGGSGLDTLRGGAGEDILIAGTTTYYDEVYGTLNLAAVNAIMAEWSRTDLVDDSYPTGYGSRRDHLSGALGGGLNGTWLLNGTTVSKDVGISNILYGEADLDWFLVGSDDQVSDWNNPPGETKTLL